MSITLALFIVVQILFASALRPNPLPSTTKTSATNLENSSGRQISGNQVSTCLNGTGQDLSELGTCLALATLLGATCFCRIRRHRD